VGTSNRTANLQTHLFTLNLAKYSSYDSIQSHKPPTRRIPPHNAPTSPTILRTQIQAHLHPHNILPISPTPPNLRNPTQSPYRFLPLLPVLYLPTRYALYTMGESVMGSAIHVDGLEWDMFDLACIRFLGDRVGVICR
jgi:hypothetical protein